MLIKFWSKCRCAGGQVQRVRHRMPAHMVPWRRAWIVEQRTDDWLYVSSFPLLTLCARQFIIVKIKVHHVAGGILKPCRSAIRQTIFYFVFPYGRAGIGRKEGGGGTRRGCTYLNNSCPRQETPSAAATDNCFGLLLPAEAYITLDVNKGQARPPFHYPPSPPCCPAKWFQVQSKTTRQDMAPNMDTDMQIDAKRRSLTH